MATISGKAKSGTGSPEQSPPTSNYIGGGAQFQTPGGKPAGSSSEIGKLVGGGGSSAPKPSNYQAPVPQESKAATQLTQPIDIPEENPRNLPPPRQQYTDVSGRQSYTGRGGDVLGNVTTRGAPPNGRIRGTAQPIEGGLARALSGGPEPPVKQTIAGGFETAQGQKIDFGTGAPPNFQDTRGGSYAIGPGQGVIPSSQPYSSERIEVYDRSPSLKSDVASYERALTPSEIGRSTPAQRRAFTERYGPQPNFIQVPDTTKLPVKGLQAGFPLFGAFTPPRFAEEGLNQIRADAFTYSYGGIKSIQALPFVKNSAIARGAAGGLEVVPEILADVSNPFRTIRTRPISAALFVGAPGVAGKAFRFIPKSGLGRAALAGAYAFIASGGLGEKAQEASIRIPVSLAAYSVTGAALERGVQSVARFGTRIELARVGRAPSFDAPRELPKAVSGQYQSYLDVRRDAQGTPIGVSGEIQTIGTFREGGVTFRQRSIISPQLSRAFGPGSLNDVYGPVRVRATTYRVSGGRELEIGSEFAQGSAILNLRSGRLGVNLQDTRLVSGKSPLPGFSTLGYSGAAQGRGIGYVLPKRILSASGTRAQVSYSEKIAEGITRSYSYGLVAQRSPAVLRAGQLEIFPARGGVGILDDYSKFSEPVIGSFVPAPRTGPSLPKLPGLKLPKLPAQSSARMQAFDTIRDVSGYSPVVLSSKSASPKAAAIASPRAIERGAASFASLPVVSQIRGEAISAPLRLRAALPSFKFAQPAISRTASQSRSSFSFAAAQRGAQLPALSFSSASAQAQRSAQISGVSFASASAQAQAQISLPVIAAPLVPSFPVTGAFGARFFRPSSPFFPGGGFASLGGGGGPDFSGAPSKGKKRKKKYLPSIAAVLYNVTAPAGSFPTRKLTGFEVRPVITRSAKRRRK